MPDDSKTPESTPLTATQKRNDLRSAATAKNDENEQKRLGAEQKREQQLAEKKANEGAAGAKGTKFTNGPAGLTASSHAMDRDGTLPGGSVVDTEQTRRGVTANTSGEHTLHMEAAKQVAEEFSEASEDDPGITYRTTPRNLEEQAELQSRSAEVLTDYVGRTGTLAPKLGPLTARTASIGTARLNEQDETDAQKFRGSNYVVIDS